LKSKDKVKIIKAGTDLFISIIKKDQTIAALLIEKGIVSVLAPLVMEMELVNQDENRI